jgi:hypothetical protein
MIENVRKIIKDIVNNINEICSIFLIKNLSCIVNLIISIFYIIYKK